jgi:Flp pilus assembly protein TadG
MRSLRIAREDRGQSLIEVALVLPLLLFIVLGLVDIGRVFSFKLAVANAAREAAIHAARVPAATRQDVCQRARTELGVGTVADACNGAPVFVTCTRNLVTPQPCDAGMESSPDYSFLYRTTGEGGADVVVSVRYDVTLLTGYLVGTVFNVNPVSVRASAFFPGLGQ